MYLLFLIFSCLLLKFFLLTFLLTLHGILLFLGDVFYEAYPTDIGIFAIILLVYILFLKVVLVVNGIDILMIVGSEIYIGGGKYALAAKKSLFDIISRNTVNVQQVKDIVALTKRINSKYLVNCLIISINRRNARKGAKFIHIAKKIATLFIV
jgi:hypothetical protein